MCRSQMVMVSITIIATLFCSALIVTAQSATAEKQKDIEQPKLKKLRFRNLKFQGSPQKNKKKQIKKNWMNALHSISRFPEIIEPKALLSFLNALSSSITLKANSAETTLRRSRRKKSLPKNPYGGFTEKFHRMGVSLQIIRLSA